jgi:hypothetical protein
METKFKKERAEAQLRLDALHREITPLPKEQVISPEDEQAILALMAADDFEAEERRLAKLRNPSTTLTRRNKTTETTSSSPVIDWYQVGKAEGQKLANLRGPSSGVIPISPLDMGPSSEWHLVKNEAVDGAVKPMSPSDVEKIMGPTLDWCAVGNERPLLIEMMEMIVSLGVNMELLTLTINNNASAIDMDLYINYASLLGERCEAKIVEHFEVTHRRRTQFYQSRNHGKHTFSIRVTLYK